MRHIMVTKILKYYAVFDPAYARGSSMLIVREDHSVAETWDNITIPELFQELGIWAVNEALIESQYVWKNNHTALQLAAARGQIEAVLKLHRVPYTTIPPMVWHKYHKFKELGNTHKNYMYTMMSKITRTPKRDIHDCALMYMAHYKVTLKQMCVANHINLKLLTGK